MKKLARFGELALVLAAAGLTAIWLSLWVNWAIHLALPVRALPFYWPLLLSIAGFVLLFVSLVLVRTRTEIRLRRLRALQEAAARA